MLIIQAYMKSNDNAVSQADKHHISCLSNIKTGFLAILIKFFFVLDNKHLTPSSMRKN